jgi:hypothetical protein
MPNFRWLTDRGAVGLMNSRIANFPWPRDLESTVDPLRGGAYLTLGAGTRCAVGPPGGEGYRNDERLREGPASVVYARRNLQAPGAEAFQLNPLLIQETNSGLGYRAQPGALGDLLHGGGFKTAVLGDADRTGEPHREGVLTVMDSRGRADFADFNLSVTSPPAPFGRQISLEKLERSLTSALSVAHLIVVDWGDSARLDDRRIAMLPEAKQAATARGLQRIDRLFGLLRRTVDFRRDVLMVVSPYPSRAANAAFDRLTPLLIVGKGVRHGLLTSPTTRRIGVAANLDVAPTVAAMMGIDSLPSAIVGRPITVRRDPQPWARLVKLRSRLLEVEGERRNALHDVTGGLTFGMALFAVLFFFARGEGMAWVPLTLILLPASIPLALFLLSLTQWPSVDAFYGALIALILALSAFASVFARIRNRSADALGFLAFATFAAVTADGLAGFPHMPYCILSYSLIEGARYYGIGNEYMGAFLAATALGATLAFNRSERRLPPLPRIGVAALFLLATLVLAGPSFGAKFGGAIAAAGALGLCGLLLSYGRIGWKHVFAILAGIVAVVALVIALDQLRGGHSSHVGRLFSAIRSGGLDELSMVMQRKASMNFRLFRFSPWSRLMEMGLLASLLGLRSRRLRRLPLWPEGPAGAGIAGALTAAAIAFLVDDAGVLAAATALIFVPPAIACAERESLFRNSKP